MAELGAAGGSAAHLRPLTEPLFWVTILVKGFGLSGADSIVV